MQEITVLKSKQETIYLKSDNEEIALDSFIFANSVIREIVFIRLTYNQIQSLFKAYFLKEKISHFFAKLMRIEIHGLLKRSKKNNWKKREYRKLLREYPKLFLEAKAYKTYHIPQKGSSVFFSPPDSHYLNKKDVIQMEYNGQTYLCNNLKIQNEFSADGYKEFLIDFCPNIDRSTPTFYSNPYTFRFDPKPKP